MSVYLGYPTGGVVNFSSYTVKCSFYSLAGPGPTGAGVRLYGHARACTVNKPHEGSSEGSFQQ
jgi:hypothetical protein